MLLDTVGFLFRSFPEQYCSDNCNCVQKNKKTFNLEQRKLKINSSFFLTNFDGIIFKTTLSNKRDETKSKLRYTISPIELKLRLFVERGFGLI